MEKLAWEWRGVFLDNEVSEVKDCKDSLKKMNLIIGASAIRVGAAW